ncbi:MAG: tRNA (adenosine(37)-N6)-threonylcarbamoyltransferase complex dimerization subunit type 1 TsaB [Deltaproteobacteria bacterium]|nr:tRNA (adenosine(37)-N6)-threonylcarbamoyltransferase complex dimerization subunit type 1 TsaB [Deltaproteobacteria bacterium]
MRVLAIDSATSTASLALLQDELLLGCSMVLSPKGHTVSLVGDVERLLSSVGISLADVDAFAVGLGPGSFTGVRAGLAVAKGLALGTGKPLYGVGSLDALAQGMVGCSGIIAAITDGRREEVFASVFRASDGGHERVIDAINERPERIGAVLAERFAGERVWVVGDLDASLRARVVLGAGSLSLSFAPRAMGTPDARWIAREALAGRAVLDDGSMEPTYVRPMDAKLPAARRPIVAEPG